MRRFLVSIGLFDYYTAFNECIGLLRRVDTEDSLGPQKKLTRLRYKSVGIRFGALSIRNPAKTELRGDLQPEWNP